MAAIVGRARGLAVGRHWALNLCEPFLSRLFVDGLVSKPVSIWPRRRAVQELDTGPLHASRIGEDVPNIVEIR